MDMKDANLNMKIHVHLKNTFEAKLETEGSRLAAIFGLTPTPLIDIVYVRSSTDLKSAFSRECVAFVLRLQTLGNQRENPASQILVPGNRGEIFMMASEGQIRNLGWRAAESGPSAAVHPFGTSTVRQEILEIGN